MRPVPTHSSTTLTNSSESIKATIDVSNMAHVMNHLSNLYSDTIMAVEREYSTNALDSHIAVGNTDPIRVTLPTDDYRFFEVQDQGLGLDIDELREVYLSYGASTKRESDDFNGTLGFGSKSGTTYAPQGWQVTAVKDGEKVLATVAVDPEGVPTMDILWRDSTDEPNGVKVSIPVRAEHVWEFRRKALELFRYWQPENVNLIEGDTDQEIEFTTVFDDATWIDEDVALVPTGIGSKVVMGNVAYDVNRSTGWGYNVVAFVPMGSVHFAPSREALKYTDLTNDTLDTLFDYIDARAVELVRSYVEDASTPWNRLVKWEEMVANTSYRNRQMVDRYTLDLLPKQWVDRNGFRFYPNRYRNQADEMSRLHWKGFNGDTIVVQNYEHRTLTPTARYALRQLAANIDGHFRSITVISGSVDDIEFLEGWDGHLHEWEEVKERFPKPKKARTGSSKTSYSVIMPNGEITEKTDFDPADGPIAYGVEINLSMAHQKLPNYQVVSLKRSNQIDKFVRNNPTAKSHGFVLTKKRALIERKLTEADSDFAWGGYWKFLTPVIEQIEDPELKGIVELVQGEEPSNVTRARVLNVDIPESKLSEELSARYPLLEAIYSYRLDRPDVVEQLVYYLNGVYREIEVNNLFEVDEASISA